MIPVAPITATRIIRHYKGGHDADLSEQSGKIVVEAFAGHQTVPERYHDCKRKPDGPIRRRIIEKLPAVDALIPRLGDHERAVLRPVAVLALHFEIERAHQNR
jgi:hypothetical protein